jgi:hypothetical protein
MVASKLTDFQQEHHTMATPSNGIPPEVIRDFMPPYHLSHDLLAATIAALPRPPPGSTTAWRQARLTRLFQEVTDLHPADAAQASLATQFLTTRALADAYKARAHTPDLDIDQMCRLGRTADALLRSVAALERTLARRQKLPVSFYGTVVQDEVDIPALATIWASGIAASAGAGSPASTTTATTPSPATPQPATATTPLDPGPDSRSGPQPTPPAPLQAQPDQSPDPTTQPGEPPARAPPAPTGCSNSSTQAPATADRSCAAVPPPTRCRSPRNEPARHHPGHHPQTARRARPPGRATPNSRPRPSPQRQPAR